MNNKFISAVVFSVCIVVVALFMVGAVFLTLLGDTPTYAAPPVVLTSDVMLPMVAVEDGELKLFGFGETPQVIASDVNPFVTNQVWSPNGNYLAFMEFSENGGDLMLTDSLGSTPQLIATGLNSGMPLSFSEDSSQIFYGIVPNPSEATSIGANYTVDVMSRIIGSSSAPVKVGSFQQASCGGGGSSVYDALYWIEAGPSGQRPLLAVTEYGILHSTSCFGEGLALLNISTGNTTVLDNSIIRARVSPDGQSVIGIKNGQLFLIDLATGEAITVPTDVTPEQVIWGAEGTGNIYYSVRNTTDEVITYTSDEQQKILNAVGLEIAEVAVNQVAVHRLNLETGVEEVVYENTAYAIGQMKVLPDNRLLMVSEIPSLPTWFEAILDSDNSIPPQLETELYLVSLEDAESRLLAVGLSNAKLNDEAYVREFGISPTVTAQPSTVNIGSQIRLVGENFPLQSRVLAYMGNSASNLDEAPYASGLTAADGSITLSFNLPSRFEDGRAINNGELVFVVETADGLFSAETRVTVQLTTPVTAVNTGTLPTPAQPATVSISPDNGTVGTQININGRNFPANQRVNVHLGNETAGANNAVYASAFSDANGNISLTFNMPGVYADGTPIQSDQIVIMVATDNFSSSAALLFNFTPVSQPVVLPAISIRPTSVKINESVTVSGRNFAPNAMIAILVGPSANDLRGTYRTVTSDAGGGFEATFKMPERWKDGQKVRAKQVTIVASHTASGAFTSAVVDVKHASETNKPSNGGGSVPPAEEPAGDTPDDSSVEEPAQSDDSSADDKEEPAPSDEDEKEDPVSSDDDESDPSDDDETNSSDEDDVTSPDDIEEPELAGSDANSPEEFSEPEFVDASTISIVDYNGQVIIGETISVSGSGFEAGIDVSVYLVGAVTTTSQPAISDAEGNLLTTFDIPTIDSEGNPLPEGDYSLVVSGGRNEASTPIMVVIITQ